MSENLSEDSLLIISDTPMWSWGDQISVFEATLREVEKLTEVFNKITWIGYGINQKPGGNARITQNKNIDLILLPLATGGLNWYNKLRILIYLPKILYIIAKHIRSHKIIHTRSPSLPAFVAILISIVDSNRKYWHKYAGNWRQENAPFTYAIQRWFLKKNTHFIAVNGREENDRKYIQSFENPCFTQPELDEALLKASAKSFKGKLNLLFVGRMEFEKGAYSLVQAFRNLSDNFTLRMVGDGKDMTAIKEFITENDLPVELSGFLSRNEINKWYSEAHFFILPTYASEGFPKVISEAAGHGCIPIVTDVSVIGEYFESGENGFILKDSNPDSIQAVLKNLPSESKLHQISKNATKIAELFTYERYNERIRNEFLYRSQSN